MKRLVFAAAVLLSACASAPRSGSIGVVVMAHGGDPEWNRQLLETVEPLKARYPTTVAFGMAQADSLQKAVDELEDRGVRRIVVARLFLSGDSFLDRTEKILGLSPGAGPRPEHWDMSAHAHGDHAHAHAMHALGPDALPLWRLRSKSSFALTREGLLDGPVGNSILASRAKALSQESARESVLLLAHGVGDDAQDKLWRARMEGAVKAVRNAAPFREVKALTMRDDWPEKRETALREIAAFVDDAAWDGGKVIAVPYRLSGFGPQAAMLDGLGLVMDGKGLLPDPAVGEWLIRQADTAAAASGWQP